MLERLAKVVQKKTIDNQMHESVAFHRYFKKKLGLVKKRIEMQKITEENQYLLRRIQEVPPAYNHLEWEESAKDRKTILKTMALYPEFYERLEQEEKEKSMSIGKVLGGSPSSPGRGSSTTVARSSSTPSLPRIKSK